LVVSTSISVVRNPLIIVNEGITALAIGLVSTPIAVVQVPAVNAQMLVALFGGVQFQNTGGAAIGVQVQIVVTNAKLTGSPVTVSLGMGQQSIAITALGAYADVSFCVYPSGTLATLDFTSPTTLALNAFASAATCNAALGYIEVDSVIQATV